MPNELPEPVTILARHWPRLYDPNAALCFFQILSNADRLFKQSAPASPARRAQRISSGATSTSR
jgi:hypothetical protein